MRKKTEKSYITYSIKHLSVFVSLFLCACDSYTKETDLSDELSGCFPQYAATDDSIAIQRIELYNVDKRFFYGPFHTDIGISYDIIVHNRGTDTLFLKVHEYRPAIYAVYKRDTVGWTGVESKSFVLPGRSESLHVSNIGFLGSALYTWECQFPRQDDYTSEVLAILPQIKLFYQDRQIFPVEHVSIKCYARKDGWLYYWLYRILGVPYHNADLIYCGQEQSME